MRKAAWIVVLLWCMAGCSRVDAPTARDEGSAAVAHPTSASGAIGDGQRQTSPGAPFPKASTAREVTAILHERVATGDSQAACQLAREIEFCADAEAYAQRMSAFAERVNGLERDSEVLNKNDVLDTLTELAKVRGEYCAGMPRSTPSETVALWRKAALRGHLPSMLQYGSGLAFPRGRLLDTLDELKAYKQEGVQITKEVAQRGNLQANLMLARAYAPQTTGPDYTPLLRQAVTPDPAQSLAYYMIAQLLQQSAQSKRITALQLETEAKGLRMMMSEWDVSEGERRFAELQRSLTPVSGSDFDPLAQGERDSNQPIPGTQMCERAEFAGASAAR